MFCMFLTTFHFIPLSPDGSCLNEMSIAQSIISQALPALSPRLNLTFSPKTSDRTRLVDSQNYTEANKSRELHSNSLQANLSQLEETINANKSPNRENEANEQETPKAEARAHSDKVQTVVTPSKWPLKPGVLVHVNSNHTLSPKNQARMAANISNANDKEDATLGLLERNKNKIDDDTSPSKSEYSRKNGKPRRHTQSVVSGIFKNLRKRSDDSDDDSGKYKKINKTNKRAVSLVNLNKPGYSLPKSKIRSFFQGETPNVIVTEGGSSLCFILHIF